MKDNETITNFRTTHLEAVWWRQRPQDGGQDVDGEIHRQIRHERWRPAVWCKRLELTN